MPNLKTGEKLQQALTRKFPQKMGYHGNDSAGRLRLTITPPCHDRRRTRVARVLTSKCLGLPWQRWVRPHQRPILRLMHLLKTIGEELECSQENFRMGTMATMTPPRVPTNGHVQITMHLHAKFEDIGEELESLVLTSKWKMGLPWQRWPNQYVSSTYHNATPCQH